MAANKNVLKPRYVLTGQRQIQKKKKPVANYMTHCVGTGSCVGKGTLMHTITLSNASIDDFRYVRKKGNIYRSALNNAARTNLNYAMLFYFILKSLI